MLAERLSRLQRHRGFTLIELLVSITVSSIILAALFQALSQTTLSWGTQTKSFSSQRELRSTLRLLTDDLNAIVARQPSLSTRPVLTDPDDLTDVDVPVDGRFFLISGADQFESSRLAFFRAAPELGEVGGEEMGDMELVLYAVVLTPSGGASSSGGVATTQKLVRRVFDAEATMTRIQNHLTQSNTPLIDEADWAYMSVPNPGVEVVADYVVRFKVKPMEQIDDNVLLLQERLPWNNNARDDMIPSWLEISLTVTNRAAAQQLRSVADWQGRGNYSDYITNRTPDDPSDDRESMTLTLQAKLQITP